MEYTLTVRAIRGILLDELNDFKSHAVQAVNSVYANDMTKNLVFMGYDTLKSQLKNCKSYEDLEQYITDANYRMSLEDWCKSLGCRWDGEKEF